MEMIMIKWTAFDTWFFLDIGAMLAAPVGLTVAHLLPDGFFAAAITSLVDIGCLVLGV